MNIRGSIASNKHFNLTIDELSLNYKMDTPYTQMWFERYGDGLTHEPGTVDFFVNHINPGDCILEVGAHIGYFTCLASRLTGKTGEIHAFEMDNSCLPYLEENFKLNDVYNVQLNNLVVQDESGPISVPQYKRPRPGQNIMSKGKTYRDMESITLDDYISKHDIKPDFIKIDAEGTEFKILKGMKQILQKPNLKVMVEIHIGKMAEMFQTDYRQVLKYLDDLGYHMMDMLDYRTRNYGFKKITKDTRLTGDPMIFAIKK